MSKFLSPSIKLIMVLLAVLLIVVALFIFISSEQISAWKSFVGSTYDLLAETGNLRGAVEYVAIPYKNNGSIDNLDHFLSKNPGRAKFIKGSDRRRANRYFEPIAHQIDIYEQKYSGIGEIWTPNFLAKTRALFDLVKQDVLRIAGVPSDLFALQQTPYDGPSAYEYLEEVLAEFSKTWIPFTETRRTYTIDKKAIREFLLNRRLFRNNMQRYDEAWANIIASLYNLTVNPYWQLATMYDESLKAELDELIVIVLTSDIYRRRKDILGKIPDTAIQLGRPPSEGIQWNPQFSFYKNIEEITGAFAGDANNFFVIRVTMGYTFRDFITQTWLNGHKDWLADYLKTHFSNMISDEGFYPNQGSENFKQWKLAKLKAEILHPINKKIVVESRFGVRKVYGVRELSLNRMQSFLID